MNLLLIGCGNIGNILLTMWDTMGIFDRIVIVQPSMRHAASFNHNNSITFVAHVADIPPDFTVDITVLAIKPHILKEVLLGLNTRPSKFIISLLSGVQAAQLSAIAHNDSKVIRIMPNIALKTGKSVNLAFTQQNLSTVEISSIEKIFSPSGKITWLASEKYIDILTIISGAGPAYFLSLLEALLNETLKLGIPEDIAKNVLQETFLGTASLVEDTTNYSAMIDSVTSKKGVTEAALKLLRPQMQQAVHLSLEQGLQRLQEQKNENSN